MSIELIFYNTFSGYEKFEMSRGSRPWNMFLILEEGSFVTDFGGKEITVEKNEVCFFPPNLHFRRHVLTPLHFHQFGFYADSDDTFYSQMQPGKLNIPHDHVATIIESLSVVRSFALTDNSALYSHEVRQIMVENFIYNEKSLCAPGSQDSDVSFVIQYMTAHIGEKINIAALAAERHLSHGGLIGKFRRSTGYTPSAYHQLLRMQYAKQYLLEGRLRVNEIARLCGYSDAYYFSNDFKKHFHVSPSRFAQRMTAPKDNRNPQG